METTSNESIDMNETILLWILGAGLTINLTVVGIMGKVVFGIFEILKTADTLHEEKTEAIDKRLVALETKFDLQIQNIANELKTIRENIVKKED